MRHTFNSVGMSYLIPQALQSGVPSSASLHIGVFLVQHDAQTFPSGETERKHLFSYCTVLFN